MGYINGITYMKFLVNYKIAAQMLVYTTAGSLGDSGQNIKKTSQRA